MPFSLELPMNTPDWMDVGSGVRESLSTYEGVLPCALRFAEYFTVWAQVVAGCCSDAGVAECSTDHRHIYAGA